MECKAHGERSSMFIGLSAPTLFILSNRFDAYFETSARPFLRDHHTMDCHEISNELKLAYGMEIETVRNYIAASANLHGFRSNVVRRSLATDFPEELGHAQAIASRIKTIGGSVPGSFENKRSKDSLQPSEHTAGVVSVIKGSSLRRAPYGSITKSLGSFNARTSVTQDMAITLLTGEKDHR
ncbi:hypothetical protein N8586_01870 [Verrucomicrobiales bacterium]|nr:hypothetical protein [Verrucomicrobiales bacterium]